MKKNNSCWVIQGTAQFGNKGFGWLDHLSPEKRGGTCICKKREDTWHLTHKKNRGSQSHMGWLKKQTSNCERTEKT